MIVAVDADARAADATIDDLAQALHDLPFARQQLLGLRYMLRAPPKELKRLHGQRAHRLVNRALIVRCEWVGPESGNVFTRGESEMHLRRSPA